jgi:hypothetical protein
MKRNANLWNFVYCRIAGGAVKAAQVVLEFHNFELRVRSGLPQWDFQNITQWFSWALAGAGRLSPRSLDR